MNKIALVTGSSGFIGSHLVARLKKERFEIVRVPHENLKNIKYLKEIVKSINPTHIFHLSAYGNMSNQQDEDEIIQANYINTYNLLQATKDLPYILFLNFSTSSVYGRTHRKMREYHRLKPDTLYAATKAGGEYLCRYFRKKYQKVIVNVRPFSVYGEGEADFRLIPTLLKNDMNQKQSTVVEGNHDWIYIDDFISAIMKLVDNSGCLCHRTYNIGTGIMTSNKEVADEITADYHYIPEKKIQDSEVWVADTSRMTELNWKAGTSIYDGIDKVKKSYETTT
jgi:nucleoside-diphosphate-sugar epimerase